MSDSTGPRGLRGPRVVLALYAILVGIGGLAGALVAAFVDDLAPPVLFFLVPLPATPLGFAVYGAATLAVALGVPLALVAYVSRRVDDPHAVDRRKD